MGLTNAERQRRFRAAHKQTLKSGTVAQAREIAALKARIAELEAASARQPALEAMEDQKPQLRLLVSDDDDPTDLEVAARNLLDQLCPPPSRGHDLWTDQVEGLIGLVEADSVGLVDYAKRYIAYMRTRYPTKVRRRRQG